MKLPLEAAEERAKAAAGSKQKRAEQEQGKVSGIIALVWAFLILAFIFSVFVRRRQGRRYRGGGDGVGHVILWTMLDIAAHAARSSLSDDDDDSWGGGGGGFSGGGGSFGGGGASGSW